jgi:Phosphomannose isomerase
MVPLASGRFMIVWVNFREEVFGKVSGTPRFPLLIKLLDARENCHCKYIRRKKSQNR